MTKTEDHPAKGIGWDGTGRARVTAIVGEIVSLVVSRPAAPGSRKDATLPSGVAVRVKVHRVKRLEHGADDDGLDAWFAVEGRLIDASRAVRAELAALAARGAESDGAGEREPTGHK